MYHLVKRKCTIVSYAFFKDADLQGQVKRKFIKNCRKRYDHISFHTNKSQWQLNKLLFLVPQLEKEGVRFNREWLELGCQHFKPAMILQAMESCKNGDIIYYHDSNSLKYKSYDSNHILGSSKISSLLGKHDMCLFYNGYKSLFTDIKMTLLKHFGLDIQPTRNGLWAGAMILRNCTASKEFILLWSMLCNEPSYVSPYPDVKASQAHCDFLFHSCDQACLNIAYYSYYLNNKIAQPPSIKILNAGSKRIIPSSKFEIATSGLHLLLSAAKYKLFHFF